MEVENKNEELNQNTPASAQTKPVSIVKKKTGGDHISKYSGSRKSSIETTNTGLVKGFIPKIENTYKLTPDENKKFLAFKINSNILDILSEKLDKCESSNPNGYNAKACASLTRDLADIIRREAKNLGAPRYKIVVHVVVGENNQQDIRIGSRCLWNTEFDNCVSVSYKTKHMWSSAVIYVLYTE